MKNLEQQIFKAKKVRNSRIPKLGQGVRTQDPIKILKSKQHWVTINILQIT